MAVDSPVDTAALVGTLRCGPGKTPERRGSPPMSLFPHRGRGLAGRNSVMSLFPSPMFLGHHRNRASARSQVNHVNPNQVMTRQGPSYRRVPLRIVHPFNSRRRLRKTGFARWSPRLLTTMRVPETSPDGWSPYRLIEKTRQLHGRMGSDILNLADVPTLAVSTVPSNDGLSGLVPIREKTDGFQSLPAFRCPSRRT